jgi:GNAT superfamily N-acetyltransferase
LRLSKASKQNFPHPHLAFDPPEEFAQILEKGASFKISQLIAEFDGVSAGYGMTGPRMSALAGRDDASDSRVLTHVAVLDTYRGKGAGKSLVRGLVSKAEHDGASLIFAHVPESLRSFYEGLGWTVTAPKAGLAWIEAPSIKVWDEMKRQGMDPGPRREASMLRFDLPKDETKYTCIAYRVIEPSRLQLVYAFPHPGGERDDTELAWGFLAFMCMADEERFRRLPADVSRTVLHFVRTIKGPAEADRLARSRR